MTSTRWLTPTAMHASIVLAPGVALRRRPAARANRSRSREAMRWHFENFPAIPVPILTLRGS
jgi:hypothetical protein